MVYHTLVRIKFGKSYHVTYMTYYDLNKNIITIFYRH